MEEIELTFLLKELPKGVSESPSREMLDIYIPSSSYHPNLRIRKSGSSYEITKKKPVVKGDSSRQIENTISLTKEEFNEMNLIPGKRVEKTRHYYVEEDVSYEIDIFKGDLSGLILVDVEFKNIEEKEKFSKPSWCLVDITQETFIAGGMLCGKKYADIEEKLESFGYKKINII